MAATENVYFIVTKKPPNPKHIKAGQLCFISKSTRQLELRRPSSPNKLPVMIVGSHSNLDYKLDNSTIKELSFKEAQLLLALPDDSERLKWFGDKNALQMALDLTVGTVVTVEEDGKQLRGIIRYIGEVKSSTYFSPVTGTFFGIELQGSDRGKGNTDGSSQYKKLFTCEKDCGLFAPFSRVRPVVPSSLSPSGLEPPQQPQPQTEELNPGDRVTYFVENKCRHGMVVNVLEEGGQHMVRISTDTDETGKQGGEVKVSLDLVAKGEVPAETEPIDVDMLPEEIVEDPYQSLDLDSMVEVTLASGNSYGIIRWKGMIPERDEIMVGIELEETRGVSDGTFKNLRYFTCPPRRALFVRLSSCRPDSRFQSIPAHRQEDVPQLDNMEHDSEHGTGQLETVLPIGTEQVGKLLIGRMKGIQGHCNSCYMDAALFGLFSCSSALDSMLFKSTAAKEAQIQNTLLRDIVNPLRSKGFVEGCHVMRLRQQLQKHGHSHSFTTDEKDPEEFLIVIMHHILALDPLLKLSANGKVQESYCYQIFLEQNHSLVLPTVQQLLEHSFHSSRLKLAEVPSCLILQMPRFGKKFKMFDKIIPSLELDITDLLSEGPQQCIICGDLALQECSECFKEPVFSSTGFKVFCNACSAQVHGHPERKSHHPSPLNVPESYLGRGVTRDKLELFAVLCIETSHYVSFVKHGPNTKDWIFFDSMADRQGEVDGFNIPEVQHCPEVGTYLEMSTAELANQAPRDMRGVAKRLFCDAYMCFYQSTNMCLYH